MRNREEGKVKKDALLDFLAELDHQVAQYAEKPPVAGMTDVMAGLKVAYPTTIYQISGDDTSGVAGLLMANGEFIAAQGSRIGAQQRYWEFEETDRYITTADGRVVGDSWREGEVVWDGAVTGSINPFATDGDEKGPVNKREWDVALTGEWQTTGELWRAIERGTSMFSGPKAGVTHYVKDDDNPSTQLKEAA